MTKFHWLTNIREFWVATSPVLLLVLVNMRDVEFPAGRLAVMLIVIAVWLLLPFLFAWPWWHAAGYSINQHEVSLKKGILLRRTRTIQRDRIQSVDLKITLLSRILGQGEVIIEAAGDKDSNIRLRFLKYEDAVEIRNVLGSAHQIQSVGNGNAFVGFWLRNFWVPIVVVVAVIAAMKLDYQNYIMAILLAAATIFPRLDKVLNLDVQVSDRISLRSGSFAAKERSFEKDKLQAVVIRQPLIWRIAGWWEVTVSVLGESEAETHVVSSAVPMEKVDSLIRTLVGEVDIYSKKLRSPQQAVWVSPLDFCQQAVSFYESLVVVHTGLLNRRILVAGWRDYQGLLVTASPLNRLLGIKKIKICKPTKAATIVTPELKEREITQIIEGLRSIYQRDN
ncbi:MAG: PH domain-containing protein [Corynebacterium sp.]|nr:PH domain-containing protein [Corynebacterium sp.]